MMVIAVMMVISAVRIRVVRFVAVPGRREINRMAMRRVEVGPPPGKFARMHRFGGGHAARGGDRLQGREELPVIGQFRILAGALGGGRDLRGERLHPFLPAETALAMQQYDQRERLGLPRLPERRGGAEIDRDRIAQTTRSR